MLGWNSDTSERQRETWQRWKVNWIVPPEADKLLSSDCCWPPEMAVNSCLILLLQSPFSLSFTFLLSLPFLSFTFPHHPPYISRLRSLPVSPCAGGLTGGLFWAKTTMAYTLALTLTHSSMRAHPHTHTSSPTRIHFFPEDNVSVCVRTTRSPLAVWLGWGERKGLCVCARQRCLCAWVCVGSPAAVLLPTVVEQSDWQTQTCLSLFVSFWTGFLWASFPLLIHYCTTAYCGASVKH